MQRNPFSSLVHGRHSLIIEAFQNSVSPAEVDSRLSDDACHLAQAEKRSTCKSIAGIRRRLRVM
jgi:hypothetical protein